jgi:hypothetical protein
MERVEDERDLNCLLNAIEHDDGARYTQAQIERMLESTSDCLLAS